MSRKVKKAPDLLALKNISSMGSIEALKFKDTRNFNILMVASEAGHIESVNELIKKGFDVNLSVNGETAISLAHKNHHDEVILLLLKANSKYPNNFNVENSSKEVKEFVKVTEELHAAIRENKNEKVEKILKENPNLRHFYNLNNQSALTVAINSESLDIYEILMTHNIFYGPQENIDDIVGNLSIENQRKLRDIHIKFSRDLSDKTVFALMSNSFVGHDVPDIHEKLNFVLEAYIFLFQIPLVQIILKIVAASKNFKIIFDFNRETVKYLDPSCESYTNGLFYLSGRILIAAKNLMDFEKKIEVFGVLAHEMCHYAMFLVYDNFARPYGVNLGKRFEIVGDESELEADKEIIIKTVFDDYPKESQHAELIVRVPQLLTIYHKSSEKLQQTRDNFKSLFEFYENFSFPEMEKALPKIEKRANRNKDEENLKKTILILGVALIISITCAFLFWHYSSPEKYSWEKLAEKDKLRVKNSLINYHGVNVRVKDLFSSDFIYSQFESWQLKHFLNGNSSTAGLTILKKFESSINFNWNNLTDNLKLKTLGSIVDFQGVKIELGKILSENSPALKILSSNEIKNLIQGNSMNISRSTGFKIPVYIERRFKENELIKSTSEILNYKIFILADQAGAGKSSTFKRLTLSVKEKYPQKWVQFVDLRKNISKNLTNFESSIFNELYNSSRVIFIFDGFDEMPKKFHKNLTILFNQIHNSSNQLWISTNVELSTQLAHNFNAKIHKFYPFTYVERMGLFYKLFLHTKVNKTLATILEGLEEEDVIKNYELNDGNYSPDEIVLEYLRSYVDLFKTFNAKLQQKFQTIFSFVQSKPDTFSLLLRSVTKFLKMGKKLIESEARNPLNIFMMSKLALLSENDYEFKESLEIYEAFIDMKFFKSQTTAKNFTILLFQLHSNKNISESKVHQIYALKTFGDLPKNLEIMKIESGWEFSEISSYGILKVRSEEDFEFVHQNFVDFFVLRYFIENIYGNNLEKADESEKLERLKFYREAVEERKVLRNFNEKYLNMKFKRN